MKFPLLVLLAAGALSAPFNNYDFVGVPETTCNNPRRLADHATSVFEYEGETLSTIQGSTPDSTGIRMRAFIYILPQGACRFSMQINNAELLVKSKNTNGFSRAVESAKFAREVETNNLVFETSDGKIERLYPADSESLHVLNIKRGILSTLQLGEKNAEEIDVNGRCKALITEEDGMIVKTKDLSECSERTHSEIGFHTASFENKEMPIKPLNSTSRCVIKTDGERIMDAQCAETHIFRPFSAGFEKPSGAMTFVKQSMKFVREKPGRVAINFEIEPKNAGVSLAYQHDSENLKPDNSIVQRIDAVMASLVSKNFGAKKLSANEFTQLVSLLRKVDKKRMTPVMEKYFNCESSGMCSSSQTDLKNAYRQYFLDALTYCATPTCVSAVHDIIVQDGVSGESMNMFLQGISLVAKPSKGMIRDMKEIASKKPSRQAYLTLGILMHRYCSANAEQCEYSKTNPVTHAEILLEDKLGNGCTGQEDSDRVEEILIALKAIGNAGRPFRAWSTLLKCAKSAMHQNITTSALEALRRMPCDSQVQESLHDMAENHNMDPEKRIQTYIAIMRCPSESSISRVVRSLAKEGSKQVGSFISSHLKNINESSDPRHAETKKFLALALKDGDLKKFDLPFIRYSKAFEGSIYSKFLKSGGSVDGHLIYHPDSILPKSALINVTANILDVPVNVFEMAARVEGVETLLADLFGPDGQFPDNAIVKIFNYTFSAEDRAKLRTRRSYGDSINESIRKFDSQVNKKRIEPSGSLSMKILGHEMKIFSYDDIFWAVDQIDNMNVIDLLLKVARGGRKTFTKSVMFMEMTYSVPTGLGLPIKLNLKGSAVGSVELDGKFDIRNMFWGPSSMEIRGHIKPSAVVDLTGRMGVNSHYIDTGIQITSSMFTSQMIKGAIAYKEGKLVKINIDAPEKPVEIFNVSSTPFLFTNEEMQIVKGAPRRLSPDFCLNSKMVLGLGLCTSMSVPVAFREYESPFFPLSGPAHYGLKIVKADPKLTTYEVAVTLSKKALDNGYEMIGSYSFGTPGATYSRGMSGIVKYQETNKVRRLIIGEFQDKNSAEMMIQYHNNTNRFEVDVRSNLLTRKMMRSRFIFFNESSDALKKIGVFMSAEYDWYKFQHVTEFTRTDNSYSLRSKTSYLPEKYIAAQTTYTVDKKDIEIKLEANQLKQTLQMNGRYIVSGDEKGLKFAVKHMPSEKQSSMFVGIVNGKDIKKAVLRATDCVGKDHEISLGYSRRDNNNLVELNANIMGKTASVFADFASDKSGWYGLDVGARYEAKMVGVMYTLETSSAENEACSSIYYNEQRPVKTCLTMKKMSELKTLVWTMEVLKRVGEVSFELSNAAEQKDLTTTITYNKRELIKNTMSFMFRSLWNSELKSTTLIGERSLVARLFSEKLPNSDIAVGVEAKAFNKLVKLQATYKTVSEDDATNYIVTVEGWLNKKLPISYVTEMKYGHHEMGFSSTLNVKEYRMISSVSWKRSPSGKRTLTRFFGVMKKDLVIFSTDMADTISMNGQMKFYKSELRFTIMNKNFKYGWDVTFQNKCTETKTAYAVTLGVEYARNRRSSITATVLNDADSAMLVIDFMYIPNRQVSHLISYNKSTRQLDISIEFLPKMFVKLMGRLDKVNGWRLTTDFKLSWSNYERALTWVASYIDRTEMKSLSFTFNAFNKQFLIASEYNEKTKTVVFTVSALGKSLRLTGYWIKQRRIVGLRLSTESTQGNVLVPTEIMEAVAAYTDKYIAFEVRRQSSRYLKTVGMLDKATGIGYLEFFVMDKSIAKMIGNLDKNKGFTSFELLVREKSIFKVEAELRRTQSLFITKLFVLGKERFQSAAKYDMERRQVILSLDALKKMSALFTAKWNPARKELTLRTGIMKKDFGVIARFDPVNYVVGMYAFYQKHLAGWTAFYDAKNMAATYNVTLTPTLSAQMKFEVLRDHIIALTLQRKLGSKIVNEASVKYELGADASAIIFHWNKDTTNKIRDTIKDVVVPAIKKTVNRIADLATKMATSGRKFSMEAVANVTKQVLRIIEEIDQGFDNIDFVAIKDKSGEVIVSALKKSAELTNKALKLTSRMLTNVHEKLPELMKYTKMYARKSVELAELALKEGRVLMNEANKVAQFSYKIAKNLTESGIPVVKTAIRLAKDFTVRGKRMEQIVADVIEMSEKLAKSWRKNLAEKIQIAKIKAIVFIDNLPVPYRKEKLGELFSIYKNKFDEFRANFNLEEKVREFTRKVMEYRIKGMTIAEHGKDLMKRARKLEAQVKEIIKTMPEDMKKFAVKVIRSSRMYIKRVNKAMKKAKAAVQPLILCMKRVAASINKHFGPLVNFALSEVKMNARMEFNKIYKPIKEKLLKIGKVVEDITAPFAKPTLRLIKKVQAQIAAIRILEKEIGSILAVYVNEMKASVEERLTEMKKSMVERVELIKVELKKIGEMTPEEIVVKAIDVSMDLGINAVKYTRGVYKRRQEILKKWRAEFRTYYVKVKEVYDIATSKPVEELIHASFQMAGEAVIKTLKEFVKTVDQIASMDISKPLEEAWKEMDLLNRLERYGLHANLAKMIRLAKNLNLTQALFNSIEASKKAIIKTYDMAEEKMEKTFKMTYKMVDGVYRYVRSIPKKEFEVFYREIEEFYTENQEFIYETVKKMVSEGRTRVNMAIVNAKEAYARYIETYYKPMKMVYDMLKERAVLVYEENKDDCGLVFGTYRDIITGLAKEKYEVAKKYVQLKYEMLKTLAEQRYEMTKNMVKAKYEEYYQKCVDFYRKYEDKTWEMIGEELYDLGEKHYKNAYKRFEIEATKARVYADKAIVIARKYYAEARRLAEKYIAVAKTRYENEIRPEALKMYAKAMKVYNELVKKVVKISDEYYQYTVAAYKNARVEVLAVYNANKDLSIRQLYQKIIALITRKINKQIEMVKEMTKAQYNKIYNNVHQKVMELKEKAEKIRADVMPVVLFEAESIFNQTLRASVIIANETVKAYTPHYYIVKAYACDCYKKGAELAEKYYRDAVVSGKKFYAEAKVKSLELYTKGMIMTEMRIKEITAYIKQMLQKIYEHPKLKELMEHKYTKQAIKMIQEYRAKIEPKIAELKVKIAELKAKIEPKIAELKAKIEELKNHPKVTELKLKIAEYRQKIVALKQHEYVIKAVEILKQVKVSGMFTFDQIKSKVSPYIETVQKHSKEVPSNIVSYAVLYRRDPAECVWRLFGKAKAAVKDVIAYDWKSVDVAAMTKTFVRDVTDETTKEVASQLKSRAVECYKKCVEFVVAAPKMIKEKSMEIYEKQMSMIKNHYNAIQSSWKRCPMYPIVHHEIWGELVAEVKNHELLVEATSLAKKTVYILDIYRGHFIKQATKYVEGKTAEIKAKYNEITVKINTFLDETTLEDIVLKAVEKYETVKAKIEDQKQKLVEKMNKLYDTVQEKYAIYKHKAMIVGKKYYAKAEKIWQEKYPKIEAKARDMYEKARVRIDMLVKDAIKYSKELKEKAVVKSMKMWNDSELRRNLITLKGMTVGETVAEIKNLPEKVKAVYGKALKVAQKKVEELKARYDAHLKPYVQRVEKVVMAVVDELNATAVFVYRYYDLKGNMIKTRDYLKSRMIEARDFVKDSAKKYKAIAMQKVKKILPQVAPTMKMYAKKLAKASIKSLHSSLVFVENVDIKPYIAKLKSLKTYVPDLNKYVLLDTADNLLVFRIPHYKPVEPSFSYQIRKVDTTVRNAADKITRETVQLTKKMIAFARNKIDYARNKTAEIREDFNTSVAAHTVIGRYLYKRASDVSDRVWKYSVVAKEELHQKLKTKYVEAKKYAEMYSEIALKKGKDVSSAVMLFAKNAVVDVTYSNGIGEAYDKAEMYTKTAINAVKAELEPVYDMAKSYARNVWKTLNLRYKMMLYKAKPYYLVLKSATQEWKNGAKFRTAFRVVEVQMKKAYLTAYRTLVKKLNEVKAKAMDTINPEDVTMLKEYLSTHKEIAQKYAKRLYKLYKIRKVRMDKYIRNAKNLLRKTWKRQPISPFKSFAMIFGANHVMSFDGKFYDIPQFPKSTCTYLLARDFVNGKFTIMSQKENLIVKTTDIEVIIHQNGRVTSTVMKNGLKKEVKDLPVESETGNCVMKKNVVHCDFKQGLQVRCHTDKFMCTIALSSWHYGKTQGLLGTNNNEMYDEFKLPDNTITDSVREFVNSWLVTKSGSCMIKEETNEAPMCSKAPSERCFELFKSEKSPFASYFQTVDPLPFLKACLADTADCETKQDAAITHCNATAAYRRVLKENGQFTYNVLDCLVHKKTDGKFVKPGDKWSEPITNDVDVVVIISQRAMSRTMRRTMALSLFNIDKRLAKRGLNTRYALVGFGGDKVHEEPHSHTVGGQIFTSAGTISKVIKDMSYTGQSSNKNDIYAAISFASHLAFRPGARKVFMLFNFDENKPCFFGPTLDETVYNLRYKANATLIAFDNFDFMRYGKSRVIGQTESRVYLSPDYQAVPLKDFKMPRSSVTKLVRVSDGAMFTNSLKASESKIIVTAAVDALMQPLDSRTTGVQCCKMTFKSPRCRISDPLKC